MPHSRSIGRSRALRRIALCALFAGLASFWVALAPPSGAEEPDPNERMLLPVGGGLHLSIAERHWARERVENTESGLAQLVLRVITKRRFGCSNYTLQSHLEREGDVIRLAVEHVEAYALCIPPIGPAVGSHSLDVTVGEYRLEVRSEGYLDIFRLTVSDDTVVLRAEQSTFSSLRPTRADGTEVPSEILVPLASARVVVAHCRYVGPPESQPGYQKPCIELFAGLAKLGEEITAVTDLQADPGWRNFLRQLGAAKQANETRVFRLPAPETTDPAERDAYYQAKVAELRTMVEPLVQAVSESEKAAVEAAPEPAATEAPADAAKAADGKAPAAKGPDAKAGDAKAGDAKAPDAKAAPKPGAPAPPAAKAPAPKPARAEPAPPKLGDNYRVRVVTWLGHEFCC